MRRTNAGQAIHRAHVRRQRRLIGYEDGEAVFHGEDDAAPGAGEALLIARKGRLSSRVDGTAQASEKGIIHGWTPRKGNKNTPPV